MRPLFDSWKRAPLSVLSIVVTALLLAGTVAFLVIEASWGGHRERLTGQAAFVAGSIGTEFIPLPVLEVLPALDPVRFPAPTAAPETGAWEGGWVEMYGFLSRRGQEEAIPPLEPQLAELLERDPVRRALPVGFALSHFRPGSPDPSPVRFVGIACAGCHSARLPDRGPAGRLVYGAGNPTLDLIGFFEAFRSVLIAKRFRATVPDEARQDRSLTEGPDLDPEVDPEAFEYVLSLESVDRARRELALPPVADVWERLMIRVWLSSIRGLAESNLKKYDLPPSPDQLRTPEYNPIGPGRTQPFVTLVNAVLDLPARNNYGYSKIPAVFRQGDRPWAQFDGSVNDPNTRSGLAAMTAGGSVHSLGGLGAGDHVVEAASYTVERLVGPRWAEVFGEPPGGPPPDTPAGDAEAAELDEPQRRGREVYREYCARCHGRPDPDEPRLWMTDHPDDRDLGRIVPAIDPFAIHDARPEDWVEFADADEWRRQRTDPNRVSFPNARRMPYVLFSYFDREHPRKVTGEYYPLQHPLAIEREGIRNSGGYVNAPIDSAFARAPYLHNGSVPTLAQLINLERRPMTFLRGGDGYDPDAVGLKTPGGSPSAGEVPVIGRAELVNLVPRALTFEEGKGAEDRPAPESRIAAAASPPDTGRGYWLFDATAQGNLNEGHNYPWAYDDPARDEAALRDLLAYLKTL